MIDFPSSPTNGQQFSAPNGCVYEYVSASSYWKSVYPLTQPMGGQILYDFTSATDVQNINIFPLPINSVIEVYFTFITVGADNIGIVFHNAFGALITSNSYYTGQMYSYSSVAGAKGSNNMSLGGQFSLAEVAAGGIASGRVHFPSLTNGSGFSHLWNHHPSLSLINMHRSYNGPTGYGLHFYCGGANIRSDSTLRVVAWPGTS